MNCKSFKRIVVFVFFLSLLLASVCCNAEEQNEVVDTLTSDYSDPGKWVLTPEKSLFFSINGLVNSDYFTSEIDHSEPPMSDYIDNSNMKAAADFCATKSIIKKGMYFYILNASSPAQLRISEFNYEIPPFALTIKLPVTDKEEESFPFLVISQKPVKNISVLSLKDSTDAEVKTKLDKELNQFFASDSSFIPYTLSQQKAKSATKEELGTYIDETMKVSAVQFIDNPALKDYTFVRGGFEIDESFVEEFSAVVFPNGKFKVLPNYLIDTVFVVNDRLYFCGIWVFPETGWHDYIIFRVEADNLTKVFNEDAYSD